MAKATATVLAPVSNDGKRTIELGTPYTVEAQFKGSCPFIFHRWSVEEVKAKSEAKKGSEAKKTDNLESYVYRDADGVLAIPGEYFRRSAVMAAKFIQDPRSPRKSAMDLFTAGLVALTEYCTLGVKDWDYVDQRRVVVQRNGITRARPAMHTGWEATAHFAVLLPEYITEDLLNQTFFSAGRLVGVGDFRPSYGRFRVTSFQVVEG